MTIKSRRTIPVEHGTPGGGGVDITFSSRSLKERVYREMQSWMER